MVTEAIHFPDPLKRAIMNGDLAGTGSELLLMKLGFRALPVDSTTKAPFGWLTPRGVLNATTDPATLRQWLALSGDASLGIVPGPQFAIVDDDTGDLDIGALGLTGSFAERTRRGVHTWARLPEGRRLRKVRLPNGAGDLISGSAGYVLMSPSPQYRPIDIAAPILPLPTDSPLWDWAAPKDFVGMSIAPALTSGDERDARRLEDAMRLSSDFGVGIAALLDGDPDWARHFRSANDLTESGRDFQLIRAATHYLRGNDRRDSILAALLTRHSKKAKRHTSPAAYIASIVAGTTATRDRVDADQRTSFATRFVMPALQSSTRCKPKPVLDAKLLTKRERPGIMERTILNFAGSDQVDQFTRADRWRRFPVQMVADVFGVDRETVRLRLVALEERGLIERQAPTGKHDGKCRRDSLVRLSDGRGK
jgi:hypothetical protein